MHAMIEAVGLSRSFGRVTALDGLDLTLAGGRIAAVLGPNGAGKTTLLRLISTLTRPDSGTLRVCGVDVVAEPARVRRLIGLAGQQATVDEALTGRENLHLVARLFGIGRGAARTAAEQVLERLSLTEVADRPVKGYSGGLRRRLDLGASLVGQPKLLLLDEPTTGLDPGSRRELWDLIVSLADQGTDVLLTTQYLEEADRLARSVAIIDRGRVIASGSGAELKRSFGGDTVQVRIQDREALTCTVGVLQQVGSAAPKVDQDALSVSVQVEAGRRSLKEITGALTEQGIEVEELALRRPTLDEIFLALTGKNGTDGTSRNQTGTTSDVPTGTGGTR